MSTPSRPRRNRQRGPQPLPERTLSVRMYDVGFGDCFMLRVPKPDGKTIKVLFDCGSIKQGTNPMKDVVRQVIEDARDAPGEPARIDVVIATHRHRDHISGFEDPAWEEVEVGEVWMPWTEKPGDPQGRQIREMQDMLAAQLEGQLRQRLSVTSDQDVRTALESSLELALNAMFNERAMRTLTYGFAGRPVRRYLPEEPESTVWFESPHLPGVTIHVLGPSRDEAIIRELNPPAGQSYLKLLGIGNADQPRPFGEDWVVSVPEYDSLYTDLSLRLPPADRNTVCEIGLGLDEAVAAALDKALNGTSLMLVFQIGGANLLFPGDAQWGTWRTALENPDFRKLLAATSFYKVGHHGSHNATPVEFVEKVMGKNVCAMVSINPTANWPKIPKPELLQELTKKEGCKIARSDQPQEAKKLGFSMGKNGVIEASLPF